MKHVQKKLAIVCVSLLVSTNVFAWGSKRPKTPSTPPPPTTPTTPSIPELSGPIVEQISTLAASSTCATYSWASRGKAPTGYMKGMALTYARSYCRYKTTQAAPTGLVTLFTSGAKTAAKDALAHYSTTFSGLSIDVNTVGVNPLRAVYTLGIGLGMRESSGKYCEGRDMSASNTSASTAEAGMFQTSYNSMSSSAELSNLYAEYKAHPEKCHLGIFKEGVSSCSNASIYGSGEGATYQALNKSCPAFAAEYAMVMLRVLRAHYGPITRKEAEVKTVCNQLLKNVETVIEENPYSCDDLI
jgi:hypothetical protein